MIDTSGERGYFGDRAFKSTLVNEYHDVFTLIIMIGLSTNVFNIMYKLLCSLLTLKFN